MNIQIQDYFVPAALALGGTAGLLGVRAVLFRYLHRWAAGTGTRTDDIIVRSIRSPSLFWAAAIGLAAGVAFADLPERTTVWIHRTIHVLVILSITVAASNLAGRLLVDYVNRTGMPFPTRLAKGMLRGVILAMGFLIILSSLGISITPLVTALGVGGLAVALGLQDTLANLFAGIHLLVERSIRLGDFVKLENGQEGYVQDITWRTTRVRMLPNNMVIIPNSKLSQSVVTNYYLPEQRMSLLIPVSVSYASDPERVERVLEEEARNAVGSIPGLLGDPAPFVRFIPGYGESSLDFTLICQVKEFVDQYLAQHELRKRIFKRFKKEGIEIPFPQRVVHMQEGKR